LAALSWSSQLWQPAQLAQHPDPKSTTTNGHLIQATAPPLPVRIPNPTTPQLLIAIAKDHICHQ
jgi:hypothetical protein